MTEPSYLAAVREAYDTVAVDYAVLVRENWTSSRWIAPCSPRSPNSYGGRAPGRSPTSAPQLLPAALTLPG
ncbi:hypothetical protein [Streptomyces formicae]|uniref:Uncharacterized protein n=1 Tax=Streptomyces formicae TaxID=1616117 RepID=A0ABY3WIV7_9ACTN|nr:hypothetical protein J4032_07570 [Streptomyces formicae]